MIVDKRGTATSFRALGRLGLIVSLYPALSACGGSGTNAGPVPSSAPPSGTQVFHFTGAAQQFKVPSGVTNVTVTAEGAQGGGARPGPRGGRGAALTASITVNPGETLIVYVGGKGTTGNASGAGGGFNGGGGSPFGYGGGGSSDIRVHTGTLRDRIVVAGGGGGSAESVQYEGSSSSYYWCYGGRGGDGGAQSGGGGGDGQCDTAGGGAAGGTKTSGGAGGSGGRYGGSTRGGSPGCAGDAGARGKQLNGGEAASACAGPGGGGGGGYYGGGGGGSGGCCSLVAAGGTGGGGGGGSSWVESSATHVHRVTAGGPRGNGLVMFSW